MVGDNVQANPTTTVGGAVFRSFSDGTIEWPASVTSYVTGGSAGAWVLQQVDLTHGLPVSVLGTSTTAITGSVAVTGTFWQATQPVSGTVTVNAGTNLNTSALALESGGNLATLAGGVTGAVYQENLKQVGGSAFALGQQLAAASLPVVLTAAQITTLTPLTTVAVTQSTSPWVGNTTQLGGVAIALGSGTTTTGTQRVVVASDDTISATLGNSTVNVNIVAGAGSGGTASNFGSAFPSAGTAIGVSDTAGNMGHLSVDGSGYLKVNVAAGSGGNGAASNTGSAVPTQADYGGLNIGGTLRGQTGVNPSGSVYAGQMDLTSVNGATTLTGHGTASGALRVELPTDGTGIVGLASGSNSIGAVTAYQGGSPWGVTVSSALPAGSNTVGSVSIASAGNTVTANAGTGNFTVVQATAASLNATVVGTGTFAVQASITGNPTISVAQTGSPWGISGTVTANAGTNLNTSLLALESGGNLATLAGAVTSTKMQVNLAQVAGGTAITAGQTGSQAVGGSVSATTNVSSATNPLLFAGSDYGGTPKVQTAKVDSAGGQFVTTVTTVSAVTAITNPLPAGTNALGSVSATITNTPAVTINAASVNGYVPFKFLPGAGVNTFTVKGSAGNLGFLSFSNGSGSPAFCHFFNSGTPSIGGGSASLAFMIPAGGVSNPPMLEPGIAFSTGIGLTVTGGSLADSDTIAINGSNSICVTGAFL